MNIGAMKHKVELYQLTSTQDQYGSVHQTPTLLVKTWGEIISTKQSEQFIASHRVESFDIAVKIRDRADLKTLPHDDLLIQVDQTTYRVKTWFREYDYIVIFGTTHE